MDEDDDDHDDHDDSDKINDAEGMDPERLKAFNVSNLPDLTKFWIPVQALQQIVDKNTVVFLTYKIHLAAVTGSQKTCISGWT